MRTPIETDVSKQVRHIAELMLETGSDDALQQCPLLPKTVDEMQFMLGF